jgi:hypothetical protein
MKKLTRQTVCLFFVCCAEASVFLPDVVIAQEFFPQNYARGAGQQQSSLATQKDTSSTPHLGETKPLAAVIPPREKIQALVYVSSVNKEHFDQVVSKVLALQRQRKIHIHAFMHIGDYRNVALKQIQELSSAGIVVTPISKLPDKLPATKSPAWGLMTTESRQKNSAYVIEGYMEPELFFNQASQFEIPAGMQVGQDAEREGKLSEF